VRQGEVVSVETSATGDRVSTARKHRSGFGRQRELPREDSFAFVVEWQLQPLDDSEAGPAERSRIRLQDLNA
jgi:hypothetical protein